MPVPESEKTGSCSYRSDRSFNLSNRSAVICLENRKWNRPIAGGK